MRGLNAWLRSDQIAVLSAEQVGDEFNARFDAMSADIYTGFWTGLFRPQLTDTGYGITRCH